MREQSISNMLRVIREWYNTRQYTYEQKSVHERPSKVVPGEIVLIFGNYISMVCQGEQRPIFLSSKEFSTASLSTHPITDNPNGDAHRLKQHLQMFDEQFYALAEQKHNECYEDMEESIFLPL